MLNTDRDRNNREQAWQKTDTRILGQILAAQNVLFALPDTTRIAEFFAQTLVSVLGVTSCRVCLGNVSVQVGLDCDCCNECTALRIEIGEPIVMPAGFKCRLSEKPEMHVIAIESFDNTFGFFVFRTDIKNIVESYSPMIKNLANYIALSLENRLQKNFLKNVNEQLQKEITEHKQLEEQLKVSLREKELLLKEIHHRVKNNLQVVSSMLQLQSEYITDKDLLKIFMESRNRIDTMALIHEKIYCSKDLARIDIAEYIEELTSNLMITCGVNTELIKLNIDVSKVLFDVNTSIPCGLIINELVSNSLKHAFPKGGKGEIHITFQPAADNKYILIIRDNGAGFPEGTDFKNTQTLGLKLVTTLINQIDGTIELIKEKGTTFKIIFKELQYTERG